MSEGSHGPFLVGGVISGYAGLIFASSRRARWRKGYEPKLPAAGVIFYLEKVSS